MTQIMHPSFYTLAVAQALLDLEFRSVVRGALKLNLLAPSVQLTLRRPCNVIAGKDEKGEGVPSEVCITFRS
jgi:hypothetical protein